MGYPQRLGRPQRGKGFEPFNRAAQMALKERGVVVSRLAKRVANFRRFRGSGRLKKGFSVGSFSTLRRMQRL
jgi:hypothetical protein